MKKVVFALLAMGAISSADRAAAVENWVPYTAGIGIGSAAGALPPPGTYFQDISFYATGKAHDGNGKEVGTDLTGFINIPAALVVPNVKILGAQYAFAIMKPFDYIERDTVGFEPINRAGFFSTVISPMNLSWALPNDLFVAIGLNIYMPDGTFNPSTASGYLVSPKFWAYEPSIGVSWLHNSWNVSAKFLIDFNGKNADTNYESGDVFTTDFSASKAFGNWTVGLGGYWRYQYDDDLLNGVRAGNGNRAEEFGAGPIIGYNAGSFQLEAYFEPALYWKNEVAGQRTYTRLTVPLSLPTAGDTLALK